MCELPRLIQFPNIIQIEGPIAVYQTLYGLYCVLLKNCHLPRRVVHLFIYVLSLLHSHRCVPSIHSKEAFLIVNQVGALLCRTMLTGWIASVQGRCGRTLTQVGMSFQFLISAKPTPQFTLYFFFTVNHMTDGCSIRVNRNALQRQGGLT